MKQKNYSIIFVHRNLANCKSEIYHFNCEYWRNGLHTRVFSSATRAAGLSATHAINHDGNIATHPSTSRSSNTSKEGVVYSFDMYTNFCCLFKFRVDEPFRAILNTLSHTTKTLWCIKCIASLGSIYVLMFSA